MRQILFAPALYALAALCACSQAGVGLGGPSGPCNARPAQFALNQAGDSQLGERAMRAAGAKRLRWIKPGQMYTMEFDSDRLNLEVDANNRVVAVRCG